MTEKGPISFSRFLRNLLITTISTFPWVTFSLNTTDSDLSENPLFSIWEQYQSGLRVLNIQHKGPMRKLVGNEIWPLLESYFSFQIVQIDSPINSDKENE